MRSGLGWLTGFVLVNAAVAGLITASNIPFADIRWEWRSVLFLLTALAGHFLFFGALLGLPALLIGRLFGRARWMITAAIALQTLWIGLLLIDAKVFALYRFHLNGMVMNMVVGGALQDQVPVSPAMWALIATSVGALLALEVAVAALWWRLLARRPALGRVKHVWWAGALAMLLSQGMAIYYDARGDRSVISRLTYIPWAQPIALKGPLRRFGVQTAEAAELPTLGEGVLDYPRRPLRCARPPSLNVLAVLVESLRADALDPRTMPNTWRYAQRSQWFDNHFSSGNATRFGLFGLMYGLPGGYWHAMLAEQRGPVLIDRLQRSGYRMHIYGSAPLYSPEFDRTVFSQVRDRIVDGPANLPSEARDRVVIDRLREDIREHPDGQRFFGFVFLDSPHAPYHLPRGYASPFQPMADDVNFLKLGPGRDPTPEHNRYRAAVRYSDALIGELLATLQQSPLAGNTVVLITGDHGEEFNDLRQNYWGHNGNFSDYQLRTPFVLYWPGKAPQRHERASSHEDFVPTLMRHALGCDGDIADYSTGYDLFGKAPTSRPLLVESWSKRGILDGGRIYLFDDLGATSVVDRHYRAIEDAKVDPVAVRRSWEMLTRFQRP
ncbi:MAG TPA: sulfatase-like hydrolase/transferase [Lysobacter sp.]